MLKLSNCSEPVRSPIYKVNARRYTLDANSHVVTDINEIIVENILLIKVNYL